MAEVVERAPASLRALGRAAGVDHSALVRARTGERGLSPASLLRLAAALREWGDTCAELADRLEAAAGEATGGATD